MLLPVRAVCKKQDVDAPQMVIVVHDPGSANTRKLGSAGAGRGKVLVAEFARIQPVNSSEFLRIQLRAGRSGRGKKFRVFFAEELFDIQKNQQAILEFDQAGEVFSSQAGHGWRRGGHP